MVDEQLSKILFEIVIPYRETSDRKEVFNYIYREFCNNFPDIRVSTYDSHHDNFNLSATRNIGMKEAFDRGADVALVVDADSITNFDNIKMSIIKAYEDKIVYNPYNSMIALGENGTNKIINKIPGYEKDVFYKYSKKDIVNNLVKSTVPCSGIITIPKNAFYDLDGYDENFIGWGPEDSDFFLRHLEVYQKPFGFVDGTYYSLYHSLPNKDYSESGMQYYKNKERNFGKFIVDINTVLL